MKVIRQIGLLAAMLLVVNVLAVESGDKLAFWSKQGKGHKELIRRRDNPIWDVFKKEFEEKQ